MMRTEDDLREALQVLERHAPDRRAVLSAVQNRTPSGLRHRLGGRLPARPRLARMMLAGVAAAALAVVAAVAVTQTQRGAGGAGHPTASVSLRARLLAAIDSTRGDILYEPPVPSGRGGVWISPWYPRAGQLTRVRVLGLDSRGMYFKDAELTFRFPGEMAVQRTGNPIGWGGLTVSGTMLIVDHRDHTWGEWPHSNLTPSLPFNPAGIRSQIAHGSLHVIGRTTLHGQRAIELGMRLNRDNGGPLKVTTAHLWVSASTYLPMRELLVFSSGARELSDYRFLKPTRANLAKLRVHIPRGYHRTWLHPGESGKKKH